MEDGEGVGLNIEKFEYRIINFEFLNDEVKIIVTNIDKLPGTKTYQLIII